MVKKGLGKQSFVLLVAFCSMHGASYAVQPGDMAPDFLLPLLDNKVDENSPTPFSILRLSDYQGVVVLLDFWATSCQPCRQAMPHLSTFRDGHSRADLEIVAVNLDPQPRMALKFLKQVPVSYPVVSDPSLSIADVYEIAGLPTSVLIDRTGRILDVKVGANKSDFAQIKQKIAALIAAARGN